MFCPNCGKEVEKGDRYCGHCSCRLIDCAERKSSAIAMALSIFLPGMGIVYVRGDYKGLYIFVASIILCLSMFTFIWPLSLAALFFLWIYGICLTSHELESYMIKNNKY